MDLPELTFAADEIATLHETNLTLSGRQRDHEIFGAALSRHTNDRIEELKVGISPLLYFQPAHPDEMLEFAWQMREGKLFWVIEGKNWLNQNELNASSALLEEAETLARSLSLEGLERSHNLNHAVYFERGEQRIEPVISAAQNLQKRMFQAGFDPHSEAYKEVLVWLARNVEFRILPEVEADDRQVKAILKGIEQHLGRGLSSQEKMTSKAKYSQQVQLVGHMFEYRIYGRLRADRSFVQYLKTDQGVLVVEGKQGGTQEKILSWPQRKLLKVVSS